MKIMGIDPGKTTGVAVIQIDENKRFKPIYFKETKDMSLLEIVDIIGDVDLIVCEDFAVDPRKNLGGDKMQAPQVIGALRVLAKLNGDKTIVLQSRTVKPVGYGMSGQHYVKNKKGMHNQDALCHAVFYAVQKRLCLPFSKKHVG